MLDFGISIHGAGGWIDLQDPVNGYEVHKDTRAEQSVSWRRQTAESNFVEGSYTTEAVKENVNEAVAIYVYGDTFFELDERLTLVTDALSQLRYEVKARWGNLEETWVCSPADYVVQTPQEMMHTTMACVKATISRHPTVTKAEV